ncbi:aspartate dehydrogenase domain-containing protein [Candidatus Uabimicrobium amorphum]|uniref:L-aspartate dehydrogenase n=1 Tax=Uabimicrobium amorphum TaxID=2596890 RepID=A0A5S9IJE3_UABAM|nr:aspartate dehydrogenase domain-containing protein [Candidatus Uabimicrobium amorphum]BBM82481.1 L-aspartate dehydrogenase [Candidatus Uabimicrobium amorphum]
MEETPRKVGIVGYGNLGKYLVENMDDSFELSFVYNRDTSKIKGVDGEKVLQNLDDFTNYDVDLIVEVAHPEISKKYATRFLQHADYMPGSPTAFADKELESKVLDFVEKDESHAMYVPRGAMWYLDCILQLVANNKLKKMNVTMKKHPLSIHYYGPLEIPLAEITKETTIYSGSVRQVCSYAPNNVNTMAVAALASQLGMDNVTAQLVVDPQLESHIIEVELYGAGEGQDCYVEKAQRYNPAKKGAVTGSATYLSFLNSMKRAHGHKNGLHFC